jgi:protein gp37
MNAFREKYPLVRKRYSGKLWLMEKEFEKDEGKGKIIFVQDCGDLCAESVPDEWIIKVLEHCRMYPDNEYLFLTKNPQKYFKFIDQFPKNSILGVTIESNRWYLEISDAPLPIKRAEAMSKLVYPRKMVSIEPIMDFDLVTFVEMIREIKPEYVVIGADSKGNNLPEPDSQKIHEFINELEKFTKVEIKPNLNRIYKREDF